jgi:hypothetical protein
MASFSILIVAAALAVTGQTSPVKSDANAAGLTFVSESHMLEGTAYGLDAIDSQPRLFGQRFTADVVAGKRTVWYSCPTAPQVTGGSRLTFDFEAGHSYELVCQPGQEAVIRPSDC